jgi:ComF family protein
MIFRDGLPGAVACDYGPAERDLIKSFKEKGQTSLIAYLAKPMVPALVEIAARSSRPLLVPIPSSASNFLKRGFIPAKMLAKKLNAMAGRPARVGNHLRFNRLVADQSNLDVQARSRNLACSISATSAICGRDVILVDDIVTSGATILEAARAATQAGASVIGFIAFSETILKTQPQT